MKPAGHHDGGFTLIEMLAALAVIAMVALIGAPLGMRALDGIELRSDARKLASALAATRALAIGQGRPAVFSLSPEVPGFRVAAGPLVPLSGGIAVSAHTAAEISDLPGEIARIAFFPDGGSTGGNVLLARVGITYRVAINWPTGQIETQQYA